MRLLFGVGALFTIASCLGRIEGGPPPTDTVDASDAETNTASDAAPPSSSRPTPPSGAACWSVPEYQPLDPQTTVADACTKAATETSWSPPSQVTSDGDARPSLLGRWATCESDVFGSTPHAGIEFGGNGRWRFLTTDGSGALVPLAVTNATAGRYAVLASGQLDFTSDGADLTQMFFLSFGVGMDAMQVVENVSNKTAVYARSAPSPENGDDNLPWMTDGTCWMIGTWDLPASNGSGAATLSFDGLGNFVAGPLGSDLCSSHTMYGRYSLDANSFELTENVGMGLCAWWFGAGFKATFDSTCSTLTLTDVYDNCTGGRGYFANTSTLTRHP